MNVLAEGRFGRAIGVAAMLWPLAIIAVMIFAQVLPCWYVTPDSAIYIELARNVASGRGYVYNEECYYGYPPVFPSLLAVGIWSFGDSILMMRAVMALAALAFLGASFALMRRLVGWRAALFATLLFGLSYELTTWVARVLSDLPGAVFTMLALVALWRFEQTDHRHGRLGGTWLAATALTLLAVFTHLVHVILVIGLVLYFFVFRRDRFSSRTLRTVLPMAVIVLGGVVLWHVMRFTSGVFSHKHPIIVLLRDYKDWDSGYLGPIGLASRVAQNAGVWFGSIGKIMAGPATGISAWVGWVLAGLFVLGLIVALVRRRGLVEAYTVCALVLPMVSPFVDQQLSRYYLPIGPLLFLYAYEAVAWLVGCARRLGERKRAALAYAVAAVLVLPVVLMAAKLGPFGRVRDFFGWPLHAAFSVVFAASMCVGLLGGGRFSFRRLVLPVSGALLLVVWADAMTVRSTGWIYRMRRAALEGEIYLSDDSVRAIADELKARAAPDDALVSGRPNLYRGLTGLRAYRFPFTGNEPAVRRALSRRRWVIIDRDRDEDVNFALPVLEAHPELFRLVVDGNRMQLWQRTD